MHLRKPLVALLYIAALLGATPALVRAQVTYNFTETCVIDANGDTTTFPVQWTVDRTSVFQGEVVHGTYFSGYPASCRPPYDPSVGSYAVNISLTAESFNGFSEQFLEWSTWTVTDSLGFHSGGNVYGPSQNFEIPIYGSPGNFSATFTWLPPAPGNTSIPVPYTAKFVEEAANLRFQINVLSSTPSDNSQDSSADLGPPSSDSGCKGMCGSPINLTTGNVWIQRRDYSLPGLGGGLSLERTWNSLLVSSFPAAPVGMFGDSWRSTYEESLVGANSGIVKYWRGDGSAWTFECDSPVTRCSLDYPPNVGASLTYSSTSNTYTLSLKGGDQRVFNSNGILTSLLDRNGNKTTLAYDGSQRLITVTDPASRTLTFNHTDPNNPGQVTSINDAVGTIATYTYDAGHHLTTATYADSSVTNYAYDTNGLVTSATDAQGKVLEAHTYNSSRQGLTSTNANGVDSVTASYASGSAAVSDSLGNSTTYGVGRVIGRNVVSSISGSGCDTCGGRGNYAYTYDSNGNPSSSTDPLGHYTGDTYDSSGNLILLAIATDASQSNWQRFSYTYNGFGEVLTATDPLGNVTTNTYDSKGNLLTTKTPSPGGRTSGSLTTFVYDTKGELTSITDPNSHKTTVAYNPVGLIASITDAQSKVTQFQYDARGNRAAVIDANNQQTSFTYDVMNRLTKITYPTTPSSSTQFGYDYRGRRTSVTDQNGKLTQYAYDDADRLVSVTDANNGLTQYAYDTENNLTSIRDAAGNLTTLQYDAFGHVTQTTFPSNLFETYSYDLDENLLSKTDRNGHAINYTYDYLNRLSEKAYPDSTAVNYTYDLANRLTQVTDPTGTYGFTYDNMSRLTQTSTVYSFISGKTFTVGYGYDAASNRTSMTDPQNAATAYVYDTLNRLTTLTYPSHTNFTFSYDALGRRTKLVRPNGLTTNYQYDTISDLLSALHQITSKSGTTTLDGATYQYDVAGNRTSKTDNRTNVTSNFSYDPAYQLTQVTQGSTTEAYGYDLSGNRLSSLGVSSYAYNSSNELTSKGAATYTYDNNGNMLTKIDSTGTTTYTWNFENRLTSVALSGSGGTVSFKYDPFGRRAQKSSLLSTTNYLYDGANTLEEVDGTGNALARYTQDMGIDEPLAEVRSGTTSYYEADGLGSISSLSNSSGALANTYTYDSFGNLTASTGTVANPLRYTAREFDSETSLYYYRARYYDPSVGRFIGSDPSGFGGGLNSYAYVDGNPISLIDPSGLDWIEYTGQTLTVWSGKYQDRAGAPLAQCKASSGLPGHQSPSEQNSPDAGPVPEGHYWINLALDPHRWASFYLPTNELAAAYGVQRIRPEYSLSDGRIGYPTGWGTWRARLEPKDQSTTRHNFYLHNSTKGYTHGCIETCDSLYNRFVEYHDQGLAGIDAMVDYTTNSTNGGTLVP